MWIFTRNLERDYDSFRERMTEVTREDSEDNRITYQHLYGELSIIDNKVGALLQLVSILAAVYALIISPDTGTSPFKTGAVRLHDVALLLGAVATFGSVFLCLSVLWVAWASSQLPANREAHARRIFEIRNGRTIRYRVGWFLAACGSVLLGCYLIATNIPGF